MITHSPAAVRGLAGPLVGGVSVTMMAAGEYAGAVAVNVAVPVLEESAVMVTSWAVFQSDGVKISVPPEVTDRPLLPEVKCTVTVTVDVGAAESATPKVPAEPCATDRAAGAGTMTGGGAGCT